MGQNILQKKTIKWQWMALYYCRGNRCPHQPKLVIRPRRTNNSLNATHEASDGAEWQNVTAANYFWPVHPTTTIWMVIPTTNQMAAHAADIWMVVVFLVSSPFTTTFVEPLNGNSRLSTKMTGTKARTGAAMPQGVLVRFWQSSLRKPQSVDITQILHLNLLIPLTEKGNHTADAWTILVMLS